MNVLKIKYAVRKNKSVVDKYGREAYEKISDAILLLKQFKTS